MRTAHSLEVATFSVNMVLLIDHPIGCPQSSAVMHAIELCRHLSWVVIRINAITAAIW